MYQVHRTKKFQKSFIRINRSGKLSVDIINDIESIIDLLRDSKVLPQKFKDHQLSGPLKKYRECHIRSDLLLVYQILADKVTVVLIDIGSHSQIFN